ncbi:MAG: hypothetical protein ACPGJV_01815 [Bacteriovoracaceae bacterium]
MQLSLWNFKSGKCLGVINLHLSWQSSIVRQKETEMIIERVNKLKKVCSKWLIAGDFNGDENSDEMKLFFEKAFIVYRLSQQLARTIQYDQFMERLKIKQLTRH